MSDIVVVPTPYSSFLPRKHFSGATQFEPMVTGTRSTIMGRSERVTGKYSIVALAIFVWTSLVIRGLGSGSITLGLLLFFLSLLAAGLQANSNGGLLASLLLGLSVPVGIVVALDGGTAFEATDVANVLVFGLFFGTLFYITGIEGANYFEESPRQRSQLERVLTLVFFGLLTTWVIVSGMWRFLAPV